MKNALTIGGAILALATLATAADARMMGGFSSPSSMSRSDIHTTMPTSLGSRGFSPDGRSFGSAGRTFSPDGLQARVKGSNWKHPIDSDGGGPSDPPKKPPKGSTQASSGSGGGEIQNWGDYEKAHPHHHGPWHGPGATGGGSGGGDTGPALACRGRPGGC
jgi:hypothetical protein